MFELLLNLFILAVWIAVILFIGAVVLFALVAGIMLLMEAACNPIFWLAVAAVIAIATTLITVIVITYILYRKHKNRNN